MKSINSAALDDLLKAAGESRSTALVIWQEGQRSLEWWFHGKPRAIVSMSVTKSVVNLIVGRAVTLGLIESAELPVHQFYPEWRQGRKRQITLRHLMDHTSGLQSERSTVGEIYPSPDFVQLALAAELEDAPGERFFYNNKAVNLLAGIMARATNRPMQRFASEALFAPLGISEFDWSRDEAGNPHGMAGLWLQPRDLVKLGRLVLQGGRWGDQQLIAAPWLEASLRISNEFAPWMGWLWWLRHDYGKLNVTERQVQKLEALGASRAELDLFRTTLGEYPHWQAWNETFASVSDQLARFLGRTAWFDAEFKSVRAYAARGYLGQYLVIVPEHRLVAVRMLEWFEGAEDHGFDDFEDRVLQLCD